VIHTVNADGSDDHVLLAGEHEVPRWSPDGSQLLVVSLSADGRIVPGIAQADGSGYHDIPVEPPLNLGSGTWSPDGHGLALEGWSDDDPAKAGIYLLHPDGSDLRQLGKIHGVPGRFSPDGKRLVYSYQADDSSPSEVHVVDVESGADSKVGTLHSGLFPGFMSDGTSLYVPADGRIYIVGLTGETLSTVSVPTGNLFEPSLSPDGSQFVVGYDADAADSTAIATVNVDGTGFKVIADAAGVEESAPDWRPSGN